MTTRKAKKKKGKPPAFQFYVGDFMTGTITMSLAEVGGYIRLLGHQWEAGSVPGGDVSALARAMVCDRAEAESIWPKIRGKFREKKPGLWINSRLEVERRKQKAYRKLQSQKGKASAEARNSVQPRLNRDANPDSTLHSSPSGSITPPSPSRGSRRRLKVISPAKSEQLDRQQRAIDEQIEAAKARTA